MMCENQATAHVILRHILPKNYKCPCSPDLFPIFDFEARTLVEDKSFVTACSNNCPARAPHTCTRVSEPACDTMLGQEYIHSTSLAGVALCIHFTTLGSHYVCKWTGSVIRTEARKGFLGWPPILTIHHRVERMTGASARERGRCRVTQASAQLQVC